MKGDVDCLPAEPKWRIPLPVSVAKALRKRSTAQLARPFPGRQGFHHDAAAARRGAGKRGFTLLELMIVLLIMAVIAAIAAPSLGRLHASIQRQSERNYILDQFAGLGHMALRHGQSYVVAATGSPALEAAASPEPPPLRLHETGAELYVIDLPEGWTIDLSQPLTVGANGVCLGAELTLRYDGRIEIRLELEPPYCRIAKHA